MYNKVECICLTCDNCGETYQDEHTGFSIFVDEEGAHEAADNDGWHLEGGKYYCDECHTINDEDELVIDMTRTKPLDWEIKSQVATGMPASTSLDGCPFHYCDKSPKCEGTCRYAESQTKS